MQHQNPHKTSSPTAFGKGEGKDASRLLLKSFWFRRKTVNLLILTGKWGLYIRSRSTITSSWYAGHQPELSWRPNNPSRDWTWHWTIPANLQFPTSYSCLSCSHHFFFLKIIYPLLMHTYFYSQKNKIKCLQYPPQKPSMRDYADSQKSTKK